MTYHAHYSITATDCDGRIDRDYVLTMTDEEATSDFGDLDFEGRIVANVVSLSGMGGRLDVTTSQDGGPARIEWSEPTDEGYRHIDVVFCREDCDETETSQRDHSAEAMGY